jgi:iron transport multicopper oxidase
MGLTATIIEAPERLGGLDIPEDHIEMCRRLRIPSAGNAGGNLEDPLDTSNFNVDPPLEYIG